MAHFFLHLIELSIVDLSYNHVVQVEPELFNMNPKLTMVKLDWYMICCTVRYGVNCSPQNDYLSSCYNLLDSSLYRAAILLQCLSAGCMNVLAALFYLYFKDYDFILLVQVSIADGMMALYLSIIAAVDFTNRNTFNSLIIGWRRNILCEVASFVSFVLLLAFVSPL